MKLPYDGHVVNNGFSLFIVTLRPKPYVPLVYLFKLCTLTIALNPKP